MSTTKRGSAYLHSEYGNCLKALNNIMTEAWTISADADSDTRERMHVLSLARDCYAMKLDLLCSAAVVERAIKFVDIKTMTMKKSKLVLQIW